MSHRFLKATSLLIAAAMSVFSLPAMATPLFNGTAANSWLLDNVTGQIQGSFNLGSGVWIDQATVAGPNVNVSGGGLLAGAIAGILIPAQNVLVNQTSGSIPMPNAALPAISFAGFESATADPTLDMMPVVTISPSSGVPLQTLALTETTAVQISATAGRSNTTSMVTVHWIVTKDAGAAQPEQVQIGDTTGAVIRFFIVEDGTYRIDYWTDQGAAYTTPVKTEYFRMVATGGPRRDTDGDGIPDLFEAIHELDPLTSDLGKDSDGDGWSDFDEILRGTLPNDATSIPLDSDGDGWSDYDEGLRGTTTTSALKYPQASRIYEVEYLVNKLIGVNSYIYDDTTGAVIKTNMADFKVMDMHWNTLYDQSTLMDAAALANAGIALETNLPSRLRKTAVDADMLAGQLPKRLRVRAGEPVVLSARHLSNPVAGTFDSWVGKAWLDGLADLTPAAANVWMAAQGLTWLTAAAWQANFEAYLTQNLVVTATVSMTPATGVGIALVEDVIHWYSDLSAGSIILLGDNSSAQDTIAVDLLMAELAAAELNLNTLHADLLSLTSAGLELAPFANDVHAYYAGTLALTESTTSRSAAALLQGGNRNALYAYIARMIPITGVSYLNGLTVAERAALPAAATLLTYVNGLNASDRALLMAMSNDFDADGILNSVEVSPIARNSTNPALVDSDGDGLIDPSDPCPSDASNACLVSSSNADDSDLDGILNAFDNCPNAANADQLDTDGDGIGDVCTMYANIATPWINQSIWRGAAVNFSSLVTGAGLGKTLAYQWSFGGAAAASTLANPGLVPFSTVGTYTITLTVTDAATGISLGSDTRTITVGGNNPPNVVNQEVTMTRSSVLNGQFIASDPDHDPLAFSVIQNGAQGALVFLNPATGTYRYTSLPGSTVPDTIVIRVSDFLGGVRMANLRIVFPPNSAPTATSAAITTNEDTPSTGVTPAVTDPDVGDTHTFTIVNQPANGSANIVGNQLLYTSSLNFNGSDPFTFRATDAGGLFVNGTATVTVNPVNDPPAPTAPAITTNAGTAATSQVTHNDPDVGDTHTYGVTAAAANGVAGVDVAGLATYTPNAGFSGSDSFVVTVTDAAGATGAVTIQVTVSAATAGMSFLGTDATGPIMSVVDATGTAVGTPVSFFDATATSIAGVPIDVDGDGVNEYAVVAQRADGLIMCQVRRADGVLLQAFFVTDSTQASVLSVYAAQMDGVAGEELVVGKVRSTDNSSVVAVHNPNTGVKLMETFMFNGNWTASNFFAVDLNGDGIKEIALGAVKANGLVPSFLPANRPGVQIRNADGSLFGYVFPMAKDFTGVKFARMDRNGDGTDEVVALGMNANSRWMVQVLDSATAVQLSLNVILDTPYNPVGLLAGDVDGVAGDEVILGSTLKSNGRAVIDVRNGTSNARINLLYMQTAVNIPNQLALSDWDGNGVQDVMVRATNGTSSDYLVKRPDNSVVFTGMPAGISGTGERFTGNM